MADFESPGEIGLCTGQSDFEAILALQRRNLGTSLSPDEARAEEFVAVVHTLPLLRAMHAAALTSWQLSP